MPYHSFFTSGDNSRVIYLDVEEYEIIRLIDEEDLTQEEASELMGLARTSVQRTYASARKKISSFIVYGGTLEIVGGNFQICDRTPIHQGRRKGCRCHNRK
jgi:predicted DNA-binding protein (UPF0251 family)